MSIVKSGQKTAEHDTEVTLFSFNELFIVIVIVIVKVWLNKQEKVF